MTPDSILAVRGARKAFGRLVAVGGVDLEVEQGEIFGIAGPNGAGKTTLFNLITGVPFRLDSGEVWFENRRIDHLPPHKIARLGVARTFQRETVFGSLSVATNVQLAMSHDDRGGSREVGRLLETVGLLDRAHDLAGQLPLYQKKRLMLASAMAMRPRILLLDEPASGLSHIEIQELDELIRSLNGERVTVVLIEHVLSLLLGVSDRVLVMDQGTVLAEGTPDEIVKNEAVVEAYLGHGGHEISDAADR